MTQMDVPMMRQLVAQNFKQSLSGALVSCILNLETLLSINLAPQLSPWSADPSPQGKSMTKMTPSKQFKSTATLKNRPTFRGSLYKLVPALWGPGGSTRLIGICLADALEGLINPFRLSRLNIHICRKYIAYCIYHQHVLYTLI